MIKVEEDKGNFTELQAEGTASQLLAEAAVIIDRICYLIGNEEQTEFEKTKVYASNMLMVADSITGLLKRKNILQKLEGLANKSET